MLDWEKAQKLSIKLILDVHLKASLDWKFPSTFLSRITSFKNQALDKDARFPFSFHIGHVGHVCRHQLQTEHPQTKGTNPRNSFWWIFYLQMIQTLIFGDHAASLNKLLREIVHEFESLYQTCINLTTNRKLSTIK